MNALAIVITVAGLLAAPAPAQRDTLPFHHTVEVYQDDDGDVRVFTVRLEQPFLADEFEQSNYLRLRSADERAYLIYPQETRFHQKHAEFYGRLRGEGTVLLKLEYETVSENLDGSRRIAVREGEIEVAIPTAPAGPRAIFLDWAREQNAHFAKLLRYYPNESFFQYCLLQSEARYGVAPPPLAVQKPDHDALETDLYQVFTGSLAIQESLQREALGVRRRSGDLDIHISSLAPPDLHSLPYEDLIAEKRERTGIEPRPHEIARLVPADQYFLHFRSMRPLAELMDFSTEWGSSVLGLFRLQAEEHRLQEKIEDQLCLRRDALTGLFADGVVDGVALTGSDPFVVEGADVTVILRVVRPEVFDQAARGWLDQVRAGHPEMVERDFNYRGHQVAARYTDDRLVSSFVVRHGDYVAYSSSHRAIRRVIDAAVGETASLHDALDYRFVTTILPPPAPPDPNSEGTGSEDTGYFFASEAFVRRMIGPAFKISEKRRLVCFNNLVMLNNASLFYRLEYGRSPGVLSDLVEGRFVDSAVVVCPHGGLYAFDAERDTCTCTLHNRLKYLTPNAELSVALVSKEEAAEYERYKERYRGFWQNAFDPIAIRITVAPRLKLETCVLPFANSSIYRDLRGALGERPQRLDTAQMAPSAVASVAAVPGRERIGSVLRVIPGVAEVLQADPTLTDLSWLGDRASLHFCDGETILEIDPVRLRPLDLPFIGRTPVERQALVATLLAAIELPIYVAVEVRDRAKAESLLQQLSQQAFLKQGRVAGVGTALDGYRLPDYEGHAIYVFSGRLYAIKLRLHVALVGNRLVAATVPELLREVIDASGAVSEVPPADAHVLVRWNHRALDRMYDDAQFYWAEKSRLACHKNVIRIYNLHKLYDAPLDRIPDLADAKYGVRFLCPDSGTYEFDAGRDQVECSVHGNRERSRQNPRLDEESSFTRFIQSLDEIVAALRFEDDALIATLEIVRAADPK